MSNQNYNLEKVKTLVADAKNLRTVEQRYKERIANSSVDKYKFQFNSPDRSLNAFTCQVALVSYTGTYGCSSVSSFSSVCDNKSVGEAFLRWLDKNRQTVLEGIAGELEAEAASLFKAAEGEIEAQKMLLEAIQADIQRT